VTSASRVHRLGERDAEGMTCVALRFRDAGRMPRHAAGLAARKRTTSVSLFSSLVAVIAKSKNVIFDFLPGRDLMSFVSLPPSILL